MHANQLYDLYRAYNAIESIPKEVLQKLETKVFKKKIDVIWKETQDYYINILKDNAKIIKAKNDSKLKMALIFRWYLGLSSFWANSGEAGREMDYQIWCGAAIGAFNAFLEEQPQIDPLIQNVYPSVADINLTLLKAALK